MTSHNRYSLDLESSSSTYAYVADNAALSITGDISIEAWIKLEALPAANMVVMGKFDTNSQRSYQLYFDSSANLTFVFSGNGSSTYSSAKITTAFTSADVGKWVHVAVTADVSAGASGIEFYKMGASAANTDIDNTATAIYDGTSAFAIGTRFATGTPGEFFDGLISNARVFSDIRTGAEILANMYLTLTGTSNNLVGSWYATANNHNDLAGTNNLTAVNTPVFSTNVPWTGANSTDWTVSSQIQADHTKVSGASDLTNFPVLIKDGNIPASIYSAMQATGADLRITTDSAGTTEIPFEIVSITPGSSLAEIWAKVPTLATASATSLYLWAGNANAIAYDANAPFGSQAVWSSTYKGVWHLQEASGTRADSTSNASTLADGNTVIGATAQIGNGADFEATNSEYLLKSSPPTALQITGDLTISSWIKIESEPAADSNMQLVSMSNGANTRRTYLFQIRKEADGTTKQLRFFHRNSSDATDTEAVTWSYSTATMYYIAVTISGTTLKFFVNGSQQGADQTLANSRTHDASADFRLGVIDSTLVQFFDGIMDETRVLGDDMTADWIATEYANQNDPSTFWSTVTGGRRIFLIS